MKRAFLFIVNLVGFTMMLVFLFFVFLAFNKISASQIVAEKLFFEKSVRTFVGLMVFILFNMPFYVLVYKLMKQDVISVRHKRLLKILSIFGIGMCIFIYLYAGIFPITICSFNPTFLF